MRVPEPLGPNRPYVISVVCLGNICRSPMAAVVLRQRLLKAGLDPGSIDAASGAGGAGGAAASSEGAGGAGAEYGSGSWPGVEVESAGTGSWHIGDRMDDRAADTLRDAGYDVREIDRHRARQFDRSWFADRDLVLGLDDANLRALRGVAPRAVRDQGRVRLLGTYGDVGPVPDPYTGGPEGFLRVLRLVETSADALVAELAALRR